jgi:hypothetical protein
MNVAGGHGTREARRYFFAYKATVDRTTKWKNSGTNAEKSIQRKSGQNVTWQGASMKSGTIKT